MFDYDWGLQDDFMGATKLTLSQLELNQPEDIYLKLSDPARPLKDLGEIKLNVTLMPKSQEDKEQVPKYHFLPYFPCLSACDIKSKVEFSTAHLRSGCNSATQ